MTTPSKERSLLADMAVGILIGIVVVVGITAVFVPGAIHGYPDAPHPIDHPVNNIVGQSWDLPYVNVTDADLIAWWALVGGLAVGDVNYISQDSAELFTRAAIRVVDPTNCPSITSVFHFWFKAGATQLQDNDLIVITTPDVRTLLKRLYPIKDQINENIEVLSRSDSSCTVRK